MEKTYAELHLPKEINGREVVFISLVGSHNYNLNHAGSDRDYKIFFMPTQKDLYEGKRETYRIKDEELDWEAECKDVRDLFKLFYKSNINYTEILFSKEIWINPKYTTFVHSLLNMKNEISTMNMPYWFSSCMGIYTQVVKSLSREARSSYREDLGYSPKEAMKAIRVMNFLEKFWSTRDFGGSIWVDGKEKDELEKVLHRDLSLEDTHKELKARELQGEQLKESFKNMLLDETTMEQLKFLLLKVVADEHFRIHP